MLSLFTHFYKMNNVMYVAVNKGSEVSQFGSAFISALQGKGYKIFYFKCFLG